MNADISHQQIFDFQLSTEARDKGMAKTLDNPYLQRAREIAMELAGRGAVTMDDVMERLIEEGIQPSDLGNAAGSVFKTGRFKVIGYTKARRVQSHARTLAKWALV